MFRKCELESACSPVVASLLACLAVLTCKLIVNVKDGRERVTSLRVVQEGANDP